MSHKLENQFKEALQQMEAPYNPKAWESLQARLDLAMPVASPKNPFNIWKVSAVVIGVVGISASLYFLGTEDAAAPKVANTSNVFNENKTETISEKENIENNTSPAVVSHKPILSDKNTSVSAPKVPVNTEKKASTTTYTKTDDQTLQATDLDEKIEVTENIKENTTKTNQGKPSASPFVAPAISKKCLNEDLKIQNENAVGMVVTYPSGKKVTIGSKKQSVLKLNESGTYSISDGYFENGGTFIVNASQEPEFDMDLDNIYKNGVPSTIVKATTLAQHYTWVSKTETKSGKETEFHFFKQGEFSIELQTTDQNGCKNYTSKQVIVSKDYNLLAADAFNPMHSDSRKNNFMPFALTERNTGFKLTIIDPKDAGVVYQTSDSNAGWDGIDTRTGKMASNGSNYIWKVNLTNPMPGENESYKGVVFVAM
ncbi:MAG: hypothetical protein WC044_09210 [Crocinitomicaceae bacterium]